MPQSISRTTGSNPIIAPVPSRFSSADLTKVWNGGSPISIGASGLGVKQVQNALNDAGHGVGLADGAFGPKTEAALKAFQQAAKIAVTGKIDRATLAALSRKLDGSAQPPPSN